MGEVINISHELKSIFVEIADEQKKLGEWAEIESSDMFQKGPFVGGFDATEMEFTFSYYDESSKEWWFQLPLEKIIKIVQGEDLKITAREAN